MKSSMPARPEWDLILEAEKDEPQELRALLGRALAQAEKAKDAKLANDLRGFIDQMDGCRATGRPA
jgi:hypothetical protein